LVLYVRTWAEVAAIAARLTAAGVTKIPNRNPYWNRSGLTFLDPTVTGSSSRRGRAHQVAWWARAR
jgi:hypothetical protein